MKHTYSIARQFPAGHSVVGHPLCRHQHGHDWTITATVSGLRDLTEQLAFMQNLDLFVDEIRGKNLNDINPAGTPTAQGLAMWAWERMAMRVTGLESIEVAFGDERARVYL
jgi:6-pyruvoyl-tetrahydropterin synthase